MIVLLGTGTHVVSFLARVEYLVECIQETLISTTDSPDKETTKRTSLASGLVAVLFMYSLFKTERPYNVTRSGNTYTLENGKVYL
jgi:hypothetical protein